MNHRKSRAFRDRIVGDVATFVRERARAGETMTAIAEEATERFNFSPALSPTSVSRYLARSDGTTAANFAEMNRIDEQWLGRPHAWMAENADPILAWVGELADALERTDPSKVPTEIREAIDKLVAAATATKPRRGQKAA